MAISTACPRDPRLEDVTLRHGRLYSLTLRDGTPLLLTAFSCRPGCDPWLLCESVETWREGEKPPRLVVQPDGSFVWARKDGEPHSLGDFKKVAEGLTVLDLEPADTLAHALWEEQVGQYDICPRCGGSDETYHHPLCHTVENIPLFVLADDWVWGILAENLDDAYEAGIPPTIADHA